MEGDAAVRMAGDVDHACSTAEGEDIAVGQLTDPCGRFDFAHGQVP